MAAKKRGRRESYRLYRTLTLDRALRDDRLIREREDTLERMAAEMPLVSRAVIELRFRMAQQAVSIPSRKSRRR